MTAPPVLVVHGPAAAAEAAADLASRGWQGVSVWTPGTADELGDVALALLDGTAVVVDVGADRRLAELACDDLRRVGRLEHRPQAWVVLEPEERVLLDQLAAGRSLGEAATALHLARRSADRRVQAARHRLGVTTTGAAVGVRRARLAALPAPE